MFRRFFSPHDKPRTNASPTTGKQKKLPNHLLYTTVYHIKASNIRLIKIFLDAPTKDIIEALFDAFSAFLQALANFSEQKDEQT